MNKNTRAFKPRTINEARGNYDSFESDILDIILATVNSENDIDKNLKYEIPINEYAAKYNFEYNKNARSKVRKAIKSISEKGHMALGLLQEDKSFVSMVIFQVLKINSDNDTITIKLGEDFKELLVKIKKSKYSSITFYDIKYTLAMKSVYSKRLYPMLLEWKGTGKRFDNYEELKEKLQIPASYKANMLKTRIIDTAVNEINQISDLIVSYNFDTKPTRGGQKIVGINWTIKVKKKEKEPLNDVKIEIMAESLIKYLTGRVDLQIEDAKSIVKAAVDNNLSEQNMKKRIEIVLNNPNIKNFTGYCIFAMTDDFKEVVKIQSSVQNSFNKISQRDYDFNELEKKLIGR